LFFKQNNFLFIATNEEKRREEKRRVFSENFSDRILGSFYKF